MRNGLKISSNTKLMTAGAAYGNGIYLSDSFAFSLPYCRATRGKGIMAICQVQGEHEKWKKGTNVYVCNDEKSVIIRYLIMFEQSTITTITDELNKKLLEKGNEISKAYKLGTSTSTILKSTEDMITPKMSPPKRLLGEMKKILKINKETGKLNISSHGISVNIPEDNLFLWNIKFFDFDKHTDLAKTMKRLNIKNIELEVRFLPDYPYSAPFVRVIKPRFQRRTGHIVDSSICLELLSPKGWTPATSMETVLIHVRSNMTEGGGKIDDKNWNIPYSFNEAKAAFMRTCTTYGWS